MWMITYNAFDQRTANPRLHRETTGTVMTELHPIRWREQFLRNHEGLWQGCNILFAIKDDSTAANYTKTEMADGSK